MYATVSYSWRHCCWGTCTHHITENASKRLPACLPAAPAPIAIYTGDRLFGMGPPFQHRLCTVYPLDSRRASLKAKPPT